MSSASTPAPTGRAGDEATRPDLADQAHALYCHLCHLSYDTSLPGDYWHRVNDAAIRANRRLFRRLSPAPTAGAATSGEEENS